MKLAVGVDIGGTKISLVVGNEQGRIVAQRRLPTRVGPQARKGIQDLLHQLKSLIRSSRISKEQIIGVGVGLPGPVDNESGKIPFSPHLTGWKDVPLKKMIMKELGTPVILANDANAAALGEKFFGQGKGLRHFIYITVSTGIGSGIVVDGKIVEGSRCVAGEVGHMTLVPMGARCKCGKQGCLEAYASGTAISRFVTAEIQKGHRSKLVRSAKKRRELSAKEIGDAARGGDKLAQEAYRRAGFYLGIGIGNLLNLLNPEKVIMGGGVFKSAPHLFWNTMMARVHQEAWPAAFESAQVVPSKLRGRVGDLGALALVFENAKTGTPGH